MKQQETSQNQEGQQESNQNPNQQIDGINKNESKEPKVSRLEHLASLLEENNRDDESETDDDDDVDKDDNDNDEIKLESLDDIAKSLKIDKAKIYDVKIRLKDDAGEVTIGELKDSFQEGREVDLEKLEWQKERVNQEQELAEARREIEVLASLLPKDSLKKESIESAKKVINAQMTRQRNDLLKRVPEWNDEEIRKIDIESINEHLKGYGLSFKEISDSRIGHYIRNNWKREQTIEKALAKVRPVKKTGTTPSKSNDGQNRTRAGRKVSPRARNIARNFLNQLDD